VTDISPTSEAPPAASDFPARKVVIVALMLIATLIAGWSISGVVQEREARRDATLDSFRTTWGPEQVVHGPLLVVPYRLGSSRTRLYFEIAPETLKSKTVLSTAEKKRGLFHATVYGAVFQFEGSFTIPATSSLGQDPNLDWDAAFVVVESSTLSGMSVGDHFTWNGKDVAWQNCREFLDQGECGSPSALAARIPLSVAPAVGASFSFTGNLTLRGVGSFSQVFLGANIDASVEGSWATPSFGGSLLPATADVSRDGFSARWLNADHTSAKVRSNARVIETDPANEIVSKAALLEATPTYRMINRASKYNILFVVLSFTTYFLFELLTKVRIHPLQYGLLGASLTLFALLLVSFAEMIGYDAGYAVSSGLVLLQASVYTAAVTRRLGHSLAFGAMLASLFGFLYVLLSLETYSLLVGSLGLFLVLSLVMALTQRVKWFAVAGTVGA